MVVGGGGAALGASIVAGASAGAWLLIVGTGNGVGVSVGALLEVAVAVAEGVRAGVSVTADACTVVDTAVPGACCAAELLAPPPRAAITTTVMPTASTAAEMKNHHRRSSMTRTPSPTPGATGRPLEAMQTIRLPSPGGSPVAAHFRIREKTPRVRLANVRRYASASPIEHSRTSGVEQYDCCRAHRRDSLRQAIGEAHVVAADGDGRRCSDAS